MPWSRFLTLDDPLHYQAAIRAGDWQVCPTKKGQFRAELTQILLPFLHSLTDFVSEDRRTFSPVRGVRAKQGIGKCLGAESSPSTIRCTTRRRSALGLAGLSHEERTIPRRIEADNPQPAL